MTTMATHFSNQLADMQQLVLFPEMVGAQYLPLDRRRTEETAPASEPEEASLLFRQALEAGQLPLFA
jgi:predicted amidohydrolase